MEPAASEEVHFRGNGPGRCSEIKYINILIYLLYSKNLGRAPLEGAKAEYIR